MAKYLCLVLFVLLLACSKTRFEDHDHSHDHSEATAQDHGHSHGAGEIENLKITKFSDKYEIFAEINPFVVGNESEFIIHYTKLSDFKPVVKGELNIVITDNGNDVIKIDNPSRPGIFHAKYKPQKIGNFDILFVLNSDNISDTIMVDNLICYNTKEEAKQASSAQDEGIVFLKEEAWKIDFGLEKIVMTNFSNTIKATAKVVYNPKDFVNITASTSGIVEILDISLVEGRAVSKGSQLFVIKPNSTRDDNYEVRYEQAKSELSRVKKDFARISELFSSKLTSEKEYLESKSALESAEIIFKNYSKYSDGRSNIVKAPAGGIMAKLMIASGQFVEAGTQIAVIANSESLVLEIDIPKNDMHRLGKVSTINLIDYKQTHDLSSFGLSQIGQPMLSNNSTLATIRYLFKNKMGLLPNSVVDVYVKGTIVENSLTVPKESVWEDQGHYYVFVQKNGELFEKREVQTGGFDGLRYQISGGLNFGEVVVTKGSYRVMLASKSSELPSNSHTH